MPQKNGLHFWISIFFFTDISDEVLKTSTKLNDKNRQKIKEKFEGFNREFQQISTSQRMYCIADKGG